MSLKCKGSSLSKRIWVYFSLKSRLLFLGIDLEGVEDLQYDIKICNKAKTIIVVDTWLYSLTTFTNPDIMHILQEHQNYSSKEKSHLKTFFLSFLFEKILVRREKMGERREKLGGCNQANAGLM